MAAGRGEGCTLKPVEQGSFDSLLWSYHWFPLIPPFLPHTASTPHTFSSTTGWNKGYFSLPPLMCHIPIFQVALGCPTSFSFLQGCLSVSTCTAWLSTPSPMDLRIVAAPAKTHCCSCPLLCSDLDPLQSPNIWDLSYPVPPAGSLHGSLYSWPILELLSQCWGCWSLSLGSGWDIRCPCSANAVR